MIWMESKQVGAFWHEKNKDPFVWEQEILYNLIDIEL